MVWIGVCSVYASEEQAISEKETKTVEKTWLSRPVYWYECTIGNRPLSQNSSLIY